MDIFLCSGKNFTFIHGICIYQQPTFIYTSFIDVCVFMVTVAPASVPCVVLFTNNLHLFIPHSLMCVFSCWLLHQHPAMCCIIFSHCFPAFLCRSHCFLLLHSHMTPTKPSCVTSVTAVHSYKVPPLLCHSAYLSMLQYLASKCACHWMT